MAPGHDAIQALFSDILNGTVQGQADGPFLIRQNPFQGRRKDRDVVVIGLQAESLLAAADLIIQHHFDAFQAMVIFADKTDDLGGHRAVRIKASVFIAESQAVQFFFFNDRFNGFIFFMVHLAVEPDKGRILFQPVFDNIFGNPQIRCQ